MTTYRIPKFGEKEPRDKIAYSRLFVPWGWSVGTGVYVDDINATFRKQVISLVLLFSGLIAATSAITFMLSKNLVSALTRLSARVASVAEGEFGGDVPEVGRADEVGVMARALLILRDNSREAAAAHTCDVLTGLPNRRLLTDRLRQAIAASARSGDYGGLMFIDLDRFKLLNDTLGHDAGDFLLRDVAARLVANIRRGDTVARLGGDEFVIVLLGIGKDRHTAATALEAMGNQMLAVLNHAFSCSGASHLSSASIGITLFNDDSTSVEALLKQADLAMYKAKDSGRNSCCFFDPHMETMVRQRAELEKDLQLAIVEKQFVLHYQIQVGCSGRIKGAEALIRWHHPSKGTISPLDFIGFAEETGLIVPIGQWVLETACRQLTTWATDDAMADFKLAVNVSCRQFAQVDFVDQVLAVLQATGADPHRLELELTESLFVDEVRKLAERSSMATKEIAKILGAIKRETVAAAEAMRSSSASMDSGITVSRRAAGSLETVGTAIASTTSVAEQLSIQAQEMRDASVRVTENMASSSAAVKESATAALQMRGTTDHIVEAMVPVVATAENNAKTTHDAALACNSLAAGISQIETTVNALRAWADELQTLVGQFTLGEPTEATVRVPAPRKLVAAPAVTPSPSPGGSLVELF